MGNIDDCLSTPGCFRINITRTQIPNITLKKIDNKYPAIIISGLKPLSDIISYCFMISAATIHRLQIKAILEAREKVIVTAQIISKIMAK
jgi:hypothetical protein